MSTYKELLARKQELDAQIEDARRAEAQDVFGPRRKGKAPSRTPQFRDPTTGNVWSGRGPRPRWLKGKDPEQFRIAR